MEENKSAEDRHGSVYPEKRLKSLALVVFQGLWQQKIIPGNLVVRQGTVATPNVNHPVVGPGDIDFLFEDSSAVLVTMAKSERGVIR